MRSMPLASIAAVLNERKATMPAKLWPARAALKLAGTETRPLRSTLFTNVDRNNATDSSPPPSHHRPAAPEPGQEPPAKMATAPQWELMGYHGPIWASM